MDSYLKLQTPYWSAGDRYNWNKELGSRTGYGVELLKVRGDGKLFVETRGKLWWVDKAVAREACDHYQSYFKAKGQHMIAVIPACLFQESEETLTHLD